MSWAIFLVVIVFTGGFVNNRPAKHPTGHFCRPQLTGVGIRKYTEGGREGDRDWCTGQVKRGRRWVASEELIEGSWCASKNRRVGDKCLPIEERPR